MMKRSRFILGCWVGVVAHLSAPDSQPKLSVRRIAADHTAYPKLGSLPQLTRAQEQRLRDAASGKSESRREVTVASGGPFVTKLTRRTNDVLPVRLSPK